jgi:hypothetical protein
MSNNNKLQIINKQTNKDGSTAVTFEINIPSDMNKCCVCAKRTIDINMKLCPQCMTHTCASCESSIINTSDEWKCPACRCKLYPKSSLMNVHYILQAIVEKCPNVPCSYKGMPDDIAEHLERDCKSKPTPCPICNANVTFKNITSHLLGKHDFKSLDAKSYSTTMESGDVKYIVQSNYCDVKLIVFPNKTDERRIVAIGTDLINLSVRVISDKDEDDYDDELDEFSMMFRSKPIAKLPNKKTGIIVKKATTIHISGMFFPYKKGENMSVDDRDGKRYNARVVSISPEKNSLVVKFDNFSSEKNEEILLNFDGKSSRIHPVVTSSDVPMPPLIQLGASAPGGPRLQMTRGNIMAMCELLGGSALIPSNGFSYNNPIPGSIVLAQNGARTPEQAFADAVELSNSGEDDVKKQSDTP